MPKSPEPVPEEFLEGRPSTRPTIPDVKDKGGQNAKQMVIRLHVDEHRLLRAAAMKDGLSVNKLVRLCVQAYLDADKDMLKVLKYYREIDGISKDVRDDRLIAQRERNKLFEEIEKGKTDG